MKGLFKEFKKRIVPFTVIMLVLVILTAIGYSQQRETNEYKEIPYSEFLDKLKSEEIDDVVVEGNKIKATAKSENNTTINYTVQKFADQDLVDRLERANVTYSMKFNNSANVFNIVMSLIQVGIMVALIYVFTKKTGIMGIGKSNAKDWSTTKNTGIKFENVAGEDEAKESLTEIVDFLHNPKKYTELGAKLPKGALLVGPPGTGKTLLAKAVAGEAGVPFYSMSGSDFVEMYVGVGASRVRDLFKLAKQGGKGIIFIDEIDAIGRRRDMKGNGNDERENTLNQLLSEMDGFDPRNGIIVLGATNRPEILDQALLRPGRFDRRITVENPDIKGRIDILKVHSKNVKLSDNIDFNEVALATAGASGADLANIVNEAAIDAAKNGNNTVSQEDMLRAVEIVLVGKEKKGRVLNAQEKKIVAYHEIGHAMATATQKHTEPVQKITIIPRTMGALGFVMQMPEEERYLKTKDELNDMLVTMLAGRASEEIFFNTVTTGASNDIEKATGIVRAMITQYGMSDRFGLVSFVSRDGKYMAGSESITCSPGMAEKIDEEVMSVLKDAYEKAKTIISEHKKEMVRLSEYLIEHETITGKEFMNMLENGNEKAS